MTPHLNRLNETVQMGGHNIWFRCEIRKIIIKYSLLFRALESLCLALKAWTSSWKREGSAGMDTWNDPMVQSRQPLTYRLLERVGLGGPRWLGSSWQRGIVESGSSQLSTLMIETPGDLVWDLPWVQQACYLEGGPLLWTLPLHLHINQKSDDDDDDGVQ